MYIDPAAGSLILQVVVGGLFALAAGFRSVRESFTRLFRGFFGSRKDK